MESKILQKELSEIRTVMFKLYDTLITNCTCLEIDVSELKRDIKILKLKGVDK